MHDVAPECQSPLELLMRSSCASSSRSSGQYAPDALENSPGSHAAQALAPVSAQILVELNAGTSTLLSIRFLRVYIHSIHPCFALNFDAGIIFFQQILIMPDISVMSSGEQDRI